MSLRVILDPTVLSHVLASPLLLIQAKSLAFLALIAGAAAFAPQSVQKPTFLVVASAPGQEGYGELGYSYGDEEHTRDPDPVEDEDERKSIPKGESFEEYMRSRQQ